MEGRIKTAPLLLASVFFLGSVEAQVDVPEELTQGDNPIVDEDIEVVPLPMNRLLISEKGSNYNILSDNGRYVFKGSIYDTWEQKSIENMDDARYSANHMDLNAADLDISDLKPLRYGNPQGEADITAFIKPTTGPTGNFLRALDGSGLSADLIVHESLRIPEEALVASACPSDPAKAAEQFVAQEDLADIAYEENCDSIVMTLRRVTKYLLGYEDFPIVIHNKTNKVHSGFIDSWENFIFDKVDTQ